MHYNFRNTICGLAVLAAAGLLADQAKAQGTVTLLDDDEEISLTPESGASEDISLNFDDSPNGGLISPSAPAAQTSTPSDEIPMEVSDNNEVAEFDFSDSGDINVQIEGGQPNEFPQPTPSANTQPAPVAQQPAGGLLGVPPQQPTVGDPNISDPINNELFSRMSSLERQTTLLNLELKKERVANEIAAVKAQRQKAAQEEQARLEEEERKRQEWQNEQDRLMVEEQRKLKEAEIAMEKLRQEKIVKAYKETMLASTQKWIKKNAEVYAEMAKKDQLIKDMLADYKTKMSTIQQKAEENKAKAETARVNHDKRVANLESQISILKSRLEAEIEKARKAALAASEASKSGKKNPFAGGASMAGGAAEKVKISKEYAIMEITGQGEELAAKLINEEGDVFMVKVGTTLRNGYTVDEITQTYLSAVKDNEKDFLYFSAGGILDHEPVPTDIKLKESKGGNNDEEEAPRSRRRGNRPLVTTGIPSLGRGMIIK